MLEVLSVALSQNKCISCGFICCRATLVTLQDANGYYGTGRTILSS